MAKIDVDKKVIEYAKEFGHENVASGNYKRDMQVLPTGVLALDYALGVGGWPSGKIIEVYGAPDVGKNLLMIHTIKEAQKLGLFTGYVMVEGEYDKDWHVKHGCDPDQLIMVFPPDGETALRALKRFAEDPDIDLIIFDSIGAMQKASEAKDGGNKAVGGQAGIITDGVKKAWQPMWRSSKPKYMILLNQVRDVIGASVPMLDSPGGHLLKHAGAVRVYLRATERYVVDWHGDKVAAGRQIIAQVMRNKTDEGTGKRAVFDLYSMQTDKYPFGVDQVTDLINTGKRTGVIGQAGPYYKYDAFPEGKLLGKDAVTEWLRDNPKEIDIIREKIIGVVRD